MKRLKVVDAKEFLEMDIPEFTVSLEGSCFVLNFSGIYFHTLLIKNNQKQNYTEFPSAYLTKQEIKELKLICEMALAEFENLTQPEGEK